MNLQNLHTRLFVRVRQLHFAIEPSRPEQRRVQDVGPIRRSDHLDSTVATEAIHRIQELQQSALHLMTALSIAASFDSDGVQLHVSLASRAHLIDEDDASLRLVLLDLLLRQREAVADDLHRTPFQQLPSLPLRCAPGRARWRRV